MKKLLLFIMIVVQICQVYSFSEQNGEKSSAASGSITEKALKTVVKLDSMPPPQREKLVDTSDFTLRKTAHLSCYFLLALLVYALFDLCGCGAAQCFLATVVFCFGFAGSDEIHQLFSGGRSGSFTDVLIDTSGAMAASIFYSAAFLLRRGRVDLPLKP